MLFTGTGATAAIAKLVSALGLAGQLPAGAGPNDRLVQACYRVDVKIVEFQVHCGCQQEEALTTAPFVWSVHHCPGSSSWRHL